jgi:hypothetical protein
VNLRDTTRDIISQVEQLTGYPVEVVEDRALPVPAGVRRAGRRGLPPHLIRHHPATHRFHRSAAKAYAPNLEIDEFAQVADLTREGRTRVAQRTLRAGAVGGLRMDAVFYMASALQRFEDMTPEQVQQVGCEGALLGLDKAESEVAVRTLPGEFSALNVVAIMVAAFQQFAPGTDLGIDLAREYEAAVAMKG